MQPMRGLRRIWARPNTAKDHDHAFVAGRIPMAGEIAQKRSMESAAYVARKNISPIVAISDINLPSKPESTA